MKKQITATIIFVFFLSSCTLYKKPEVPALKTPHHFKPKIHIANKNLKEEWWKNFHDEKLNQLVKLALQKNYSYKIAIKNIQIACTYVTQNKSALFPQVNLSFNSSRNKSAAAILNNFGGANPVNPNSSSFARIFNSQQLAASVSYEVDLWNQIGNTIHQAEANQAASEADSKVIKLTLISSITDVYYQLAILNANLKNLKQQYYFAQEIVSLSTKQFQSGLIDATSLDTAKIQLEGIKSNINNLEKQKQVLQYTLAYLIGEYPENFKFSLHDHLASLPIKNLIPPGIPSQMLTNRPDIQEAYEQILSYGYLEKQNIANFLPAINLTGSYGYASTALSHLLSSAHTYWNYGLYLTQFVFDYQTRMSEYKRSQYQYESAILSYKNTVLNAFKEVDSALSSYKEDDLALLAYQKQAMNANDIAKLNDSQYRSGLIDYSTYLASNLNYLQNDLNYNNQQLLVIEDVIQIYKTLGLGV